MKKIFTAVLFTFLFLLLKTNIVRAQINQQDSLALVDLYNSTKGPKWQPNNWLTAAPVSTWTGVTVDGNRVTGIDLTNSGLNGRIPESFGNLTALKTFSANYGVKGALPSSIGNLTALQSLAIYFCNDFNGHLPSSIGNLKNLETLYLYSDNVSGTIPGSIGNLTKLKWLNVAGSLLKGNIPASLNKLINLENLDLSFNRLSGTIPPLNHLTKLSDLHLEFNAFTFAGLENIVQSFPFAGYWPQRSIALNNNNNTLSVYAGGANALQDNTYKWYKDSTLVATITGDSTFTATESGRYSVAVTNSVATKLTLYSDTIAVQLPVNTNDSLALVDLYNSTDGAHWNGNTNWLTSASVSTWYGITIIAGRVTGINLPYNNLNGKIPASIGDLTELTNLNFAFDHKLSGNIPFQIGKLVHLKYLQLQTNKLTGRIPHQIGNLINLVTLDVNDNSLSDTIPSSLGNLAQLQTLDLSFNKLSGNLPAALGNLSNLQYLILLRNQFTGTIPSSLGNLVNLKDFNLSYNQFTGNIPYALGNLVNLAFFELSGNHLTGKIPTSFGNLTNLSILYLGNNTLTGNIPAFLQKLTRLQELDLSSNQLTGSIPNSLGSLHDLSKLYLNNNQLSGSIPLSLNNLHYLSALLLQNNKFTFAGMENVAQNIPVAIYAPQATIPLNKNGNTLSVYAGGANALQDNTYKWYKGSMLVATITGDSTFTPSQGGNYSVTVTNSVATQLTLYSDTVYYNAGNNAIASKMNDHSFIAVYPNPAKTNATLSFNAEGRYTLTITDLSGNILQTRTGVANKGANSIQLDVSNYASGMYLITIIDEKNRKRTLRLNKE
ncbi:MAG TPA: leucine-rich repeat domain-containing protein [Parafilimonas sp.]|nr:leucine-rich repeat domain-containing protein [Parafilimonas sp.]